MDPSAVEKIVKIWNLAAPPIRPGASVMAVFRSKLPAGFGWSGMVQGATPEIVDLMITRGAGRVVAMDRFGEVIEAMRRLSSEDWSSVETLVDNWCNYRPEFERSFDIILCDGGGLFLPFPDGWQRLYEITFRYLTEGGKTVFHVFAVSDDALPFRDYYEEAIRRFDMEREWCSPEEQKRMFIRLTSEMKSATWFRAVDAQGMLMLDRISEAANFMKKDLWQRYPDGIIGQVVDSIFGRPHSIVHEEAILVAAPPSRLVQPLLESIGFSVNVEPVQEPPEGAASYVVIAEKES